MVVAKDVLVMAVFIPALKLRTATGSGIDGYIAYTTRPNAAPANMSGKIKPPRKPGMIEPNA